MSPVLPSLVNVELHQQYASRAINVSDMLRQLCFVGRGRCIEAIHKRKVSSILLKIAVEGRHQIQNIWTTSLLTGHILYNDGFMWLLHHLPL